MKIKTLVAIQSIIDGRTIPRDMEEENFYYSESREEFIDIMDMELHHFIRAFVKMSNYIPDPVIVKEGERVYLNENFAENLTLLQAFQILEKKLLEKNYDLEELLTDFLSKKNEH